MIFKIWIGLLVGVLVLCLIACGLLLYQSSVGGDAGAFAGLALLYPFAIGVVGIMFLILSFLIHWFIWG